MWFKLILSLTILKNVKSNELILNKDKFILEFKILELVQTIEQQHDIQTILIKYKESVKNCGELDVYIKNMKSAIIVENLHKSGFVRNSFNKNILIIICLKRLTSEFSIEFKAYFDMMKIIRNAKLLLYINRNERTKHLTKLENFFKYCWFQKSLNVMAIFKDFSSTRHLHAYKPFPQFSMELINPNSSELLYPDRVRNLMGHNFTTLPDQIIPNTFLTTTKKGEMKISGFLGKFIDLLMERINATLILPFPIKKGEVQFYGYLEALTQNNTIDLPGTLAPIMNEKQILHYSYPFKIIKSCLMIPMAQNMPLKNIFFYLVNLKMTCISLSNLYLFTLLLNVRRIMMLNTTSNGNKDYGLTLPDYILNDVALRGLLGQPFTVWSKAQYFTKYIYILLFIVGLYISVIYSAFLQSYFTQPFKEKQLKTFQDLYNNNVYILFSDRQVNYFKDTLNLKLLYRTASLEEMNKMRSALNTSYAYQTINIHWNSLFSHHQNLLKNKLFIFSKDACFYETNMLSFPLANNSIYRDTVDDLIMRITDHGLLNYWLDTNFVDDLTNEESMFNLDFASAENHHGKPLNMKDFELVFKAYLGLMMVGILLLLMEILIYRFKKLLAERKK